jgi:hypothetical protein
MLKMLNVKCLLRAQGVYNYKCLCERAARAWGRKRRMDEDVGIGI